MTDRQLGANMLSMPRKAILSDQIRKAIDQADMTRYRICKLADIDQPSMSRFMAGKAGLSMERLDRLGQVLGLRIVAEKPQQRKGR